MKRLTRGLGLLAIGAVVSCVTINIYFPAEEIRGVADRIVDEVYGEPVKPVEKQPADQPGSSSVSASGVFGSPPVEPASLERVM